MYFLVAIVGRANVGKSTLFNVLTNSRDALAFDFEGVTRDRQYGQTEYNNFNYLVVDTAGISDRDVGFSQFMAKQSQVAIDEANLVFFVVDGKSGLTSADEYIAKLLHQQNKKVVLIVNKIDAIEENAAMAEFYILGFERVFAISASHRKNIQMLLDKYLSKPLAEHYQNYVEAEKHKEQLRHGIHFSLIGRPNVGKSTLTNKMLGEERVVVFDKPGTTIDSVSIPFERRGIKYTIVDTAGVRKKGKIKQILESFSVVKTLKSIQESNVVVVILDARLGLSDQDLSLINFAIKNGRALVIAANKWDGMSKEDKYEVKKELQRRLFFLLDHIDIHFISALNGTNVECIFKSINTAYECANKKISTADTNRLLQLAVDAHSPPMVGKFRIKLKYAHIGGHNPPTIIIHGNQLNKLPQSYKKYLENFFRDALKFKGTPIVFEFKQSDNPFANKKDKRINNESAKGKKVR